MKKYIQFINMGIANCESLQEVEEWNESLASGRGIVAPEDSVSVSSPYISERGAPG